MECARIRITASHPLELHYVKALLLQKQYRRCITTCRQLLNVNVTSATLPPLQQFSIEFYLASAYDELARSIHSFSKTKLPAVDRALQLYRDALQSIPCAEQCVHSWEGAAQASSNESLHEPETTQHERRRSTVSLSEEQQNSLYLLSPKRSTSIRERSFSPKSSPVDSPLASVCDQDDLDSHASYSQILTPTRILPPLQRDYSSISLIQTEPPPPPAPPPQLQHTSQGLMRPIRTGEPAQQYHVPPRLPYTSKTYSPPHLPRLNTTTALTSSPVRKQLRTSSEQASPISLKSPVSPLASESVLASDASTVSPISPPSSPVLVHDMNKEENEDGDVFASDASDALRAEGLLRLEEGLEGMRLQLCSHVRLLEGEKERVLGLLAERAGAGASSGLGLGGDMAEGAHSGTQSPQAHSFWAFKLESVKEVEKRKRISARKQEGWKRERFDVRKYQELAELAMAEL